MVKYFDPSSIHILHLAEFELHFPICVRFQPIAAACCQLPGAVVCDFFSVCGDVHHADMPRPSFRLAVQLLAQLPSDAMLHICGGTAVNEHTSSTVVAIPSVKLRRGFGSKPVQSRMTPP